MNWHEHRSWILLASILVTSAWAAAGQAAPAKGKYLQEAEVKETEGSLHIEADSPRPLEQALTALHRKYGWVLDYEDPQFVFKSDLAELPGKQIVPAGAQFQIEFSSAAADEEKILRQTVDAYNASDNPGKFEARKGPQDRFFVIGTQARNLRGELSRQPIPLDTKVTLPKAKRTISETIALICRKAGAHESIKITVGILPRSLLEYTSLTLGGTQVPARDLILQALDSTHRRYYWRLLYDPATKGYSFNVHLVPNLQNPAPGTGKPD